MRAPWTRQQLLVAFWLYCRLPFGRLHYRNPQIVELAKAIDRTPSALAMKLVNIASLDPAITNTGRSGLSAASAKDREMWAEMQQDWEKFAVEANRAVEAVQSDHASDLQPQTQASQEPTLQGDLGEERLTTTHARIGQSFFRDALLSAYRGRCCITGLAIPELLIASHIVPWRTDRANRVNPRNGLLLSALHDRAFDSGLITIAEDMTVRVGSELANETDGFLAETIGAYAGRRIELAEKFQPEREFLEYHRQEIFRG